MSRAHRVLMVEDDLEYRRLVGRWLGDHYTLHFGTRLDEAWHEFEGCDLLLLDLGLPDASGLETLVAARELAGSVPIVVLTGQDDPTLSKRALDAGADAFLPKSQMNSDSLRDALIQALANRVRSAGGQGEDAASRVTASLARTDSWVRR